MSLKRFLRHVGQRRAGVPDQPGQPRMATLRAAQPPRGRVALPPGFHPQAARTPGAQLHYGPGWAGTGMQPIARVPMTAYTGRVSGVPLTGGQAQTTVPSGTITGSATSPTTFQILASLTIPAGVTVVAWTVTLSGTLGAGDANNFAVRIQSGATVATSVNAGAAGTYPQAPITVTGPLVLQLETAGSTPTTGSVYSGTLTISTAQAQVSVGPQGAGNVWYSAQATISTTTGTLDTSTCRLYLGAQGVPVLLVATVFSGNGTVALALPPMSPGQYLIAIWAGAHAGDVAAVNIVGTMDALSNRPVSQ